MSDKKKLFINNIEVEFTDEKTVLEIIRKNGFDVPTFCHHPYSCCPLQSWKAAWRASTSRA